LRIKFLVTPVGLMMGNIESARRLRLALVRQGVEVIDERTAEDFDLLHVHTPVPPTNFKVVKKARRKGKPVVMHAHTTAEDSIGTWTGSEAFSGMTGRYLTAFYNLGDLVIAPSDWTMARLRQRGVTAPIRVVSNGVDIHRFAFDRERRTRFRAAHGIPEDAKVVYSVGVVCLKKGIEVFPEVARSLPELTFVWVGRRSNLYHPNRVRAAMRACPENVMFIHDLEDIAEAHSGGDLFFTPSFAENQGMAVMEAMVAGRPVVARSLEVYEGLLKDEESALTAGTVEGFVSALDRLSRDENLGERLASNACTSVLRHDIDKVASELADIYRSLLESRRPAGVRG